MIVIVAVASFFAGQKISMDDIFGKDVVKDSVITEVSITPPIDTTAKAYTLKTDTVK